MKISNDSYAMLLLCSDLALRNSDIEFNAFTISQWSKLEYRLIQSDLMPSALFNVSSVDVKRKLNLTEEEVLRIEKLMSRSGQFGLELTSLNEKGIFTLTKADAKYPAELKNKLNKLAPPVLFYAGNLSLLSNKGVAIVGSRNIDPQGMEFTELLSRRCTNDGLNVVSGGARGVDSIAESVANQSDGTTVIFVSDSLEKKIRQQKTREAILKKQSIILSSFRPDMPFQTYAAMERNKYVYAISNFVVIISADYNKGGTWAGAKENLRRNWVPMFVREDHGIPKGNTNLLKQKNVYPINKAILKQYDVNIYDWLDKNAKKNCEIDIKNPEQISMFDL